MDFYEKSYKEALERAKKLKAGFEGYNANVAIIEGIFPELRKSEDERVRKELLNFILYKAGHLIDEETEHKFIAYLEKQKEQKPILEVFGFKVGDAVRLKDGDGRKHIIKSFKEIIGIHAPNYYHVEFEDNSAIGGIYPGIGYPNGYYTQMEKFEKEQRPAEWSEEDERMLNVAIKSCEQTIGDYPNDKVRFNDCIAWLKSLHPQTRWKPSEEQMTALRIAYEIGTANESWAMSVLKSLYNDLKKLL